MFDTLPGRLRGYATGEDKLDPELAAVLREAASAIEFAEAGIPGLLFSKRKALVERCAQIAETCELFNGDRLKNSDPRVTIAETIRQAGLAGDDAAGSKDLSRATSAEDK